MLVKYLIVLLLPTFALAYLVIPTVWPKPQQFYTGLDSTVVSNKLVFNTIDGAIATLSAAYHRYQKLIFVHSIEENAEQIYSNQNNYICEVQVQVEDRSEAYPQLDTDESYSLIIPSGGAEKNIGHPVIKLSARTVYGALRGLETLSQLIMYDFDMNVYTITATPINIVDYPRYQHRGLLLDTSRHFQPLSFLKKTIDSLSYAKFNVLHWHVVDTQSFPFESKKYPLLWNGAYSKQEKYTQQDIRELVEYGRARGVKIMIEFDMPGHAGSWCAGYPEICPSLNCLEPLNPASNETFPLINNLLSECTNSKNGLFPYKLLHLGGDEVEYRCWEVSSEIQTWQTTQGFTSSEDTYEYFVKQVASIAREQERLPVQWVEVFEHFQDKLNNDTIVHVWKEKSTLDGVLQKGYRALLSNQDDWYLDHLQSSWKTMYLNEPTSELSATSDPTLILGGEACMWGETVDPSNLMNTIWPRAAAVAEVLWTTKENIDTSTDVDLTAVEARLETFRCLLTMRDIAAAPVTNVEARYQPRAPGSCYDQRRRK